ncbi:hypothetical protein IA54_017115 [Xanthomonas phaseoli pv. syngonii LMG 9055]|uniref:HTH cro/C1-type domain-containing protein n=1 Tax=Xanthomonas phaseoli pv. syngonii LMG 9055 TaxID=1437878 RepID=A0A1V9HPQ4_9XANT|nr:hypothetical protein IA54_017115 [Xanthomonas phaseoli pv. syngonii LMG 9055]
MATDSKFIQKTFGEVLREIRVGRGLSQQELALQSELDRTYVSLLERGLRQPTLTTLIVLAATLDMAPAELVQRTTAFLLRKRT